MSNLTQFISQSEELEPETVRMLMPNFGTKDVQKILALKVLKTTRAAYEDMDVLENCILILNDIEPDVRTMQGCQPEYIWHFVNVISKLFKTLPEFSDECVEYIKAIHRINGYLFYPPQLTQIDNAFFDEVKEKAENGPFPLTDENPMDIQAIRYLRIQEYLKEVNNG